MTSTEYSDDMTSLTSTSCDEILPVSIGGGDGLKIKFKGNGLNIRNDHLNQKSKRLTKVGIGSRNLKKSGPTATKRRISAEHFRPSLNTNRALEKNINRNKILNKKLAIENLDKSILKNPKLIIKAKEDQDITEYITPIKKFNCNKSFSQMDMEQVRKSASKRSTCYTLKPIINDGENRFDRTIELSNDYEFYFSKHAENGSPDNKLAGMKIFATIMLNAWRRRRDDVKKLNEDLGKSKKGIIKYKTQIHVLNSLFKIEQKQNDELNLRLRKLVVDQQKIQNLYDRLNIKAIELKTLNVDLNEQLLLKDKDIDGLQVVLTETKNHLFQSVQNNHELGSALACEKRLTNDLEFKRNELLDAISELKDLLFQKEAGLQQVNLEFEDETKKLKDFIEKLEQDVGKYKSKELEFLKLQKFNDNQKKIIDEFTEKVAALQYEIESYLPNRIKRLIVSTLPAFIVRYLHVTAYYLLPAVRPPNKDKLPKIGLQKISCMWK